MSYSSASNNYSPNQYNNSYVGNSYQRPAHQSAFDNISTQQMPHSAYSNSANDFDDFDVMPSSAPHQASDVTGSTVAKPGKSKASDLAEELTVNIAIPNNAVNPTKWTDKTRGKTIRSSQLLLNGDVKVAKRSVFIGNIWYRVTMFVCLAVLVGCAVVAGDYALGVYNSEQEFDDLTALYTVSIATVDGDEETGEEDLSGLPPIVDWEGLSAINSELSGWIRIPGSTIDYPVLSSTVQDKYLNTSFYGSYSSSGCIFTDHENNGDDLTSDSHIVIYGHHMSTATMFHDLEYYLNEEWFNEHQVIYFETEETTYVLRPIAAYTVLATEYDTRTVSFSSEVDFQTYLDERLERATSGYVVDDYERLTVDKLFTLITCDSSTVENDRVVVECIVEQEYPTSMIPSVIEGARETGAIPTTTSE